MPTKILRMIIGTTTLIFTLYAGYQLDLIHFVQARPKETTNIDMRIAFDPQQEVDYDLSNIPSLHVVSPGETIQPAPVQVQISTAFSIKDFPASGGFNVFLNGWARHNESTDFKCCFVQTGLDGSVDAEAYVEVKAWLYHIYTQWIVDMQSAEFSCSISHDQLTSLGSLNLTHVALAEESCLITAPKTILPILATKKKPGALGICLKISYGSVNASRAIEWFEYHRLMGVTLVFTYTWDLDPPVQAVFDYYVKEGFLHTVPAHPARSKDGPRRGFRRPRNEPQAWTDEVWAINDCKYRMFGFDYVIVMDIDEFIVPKGKLRTYRDILEDAKRSNPAAGAFQFDSHVFLENWGRSRHSPLHITQFTQRTRRPNYDGMDLNSRWGFIPDRIYFAKNNYVVPRGNFTTQPVPADAYNLYHYRSCKPKWRGCDKRPRVEDRSMIDYEIRLAQNILSLPNIDKLLYNDTFYVSNLRRWHKDLKQNNAIK